MKSVHYESVIFYSTDTSLIDTYEIISCSDKRSSLLQSGITYGLKSFIAKAPVANVIKLFRRNYVAISITLVKIIGKYATRGVNYA